MKNHQETGLIGKISFGWVSVLMRKGFKQQIDSYNDLFEIPSDMSAQASFENLVKSDVYFESKNEKIEKTRARIDSNLWRTLIRTFLLSSTATAILRVVSDLLNFAGPLVLARIVSILESDSQSENQNMDGIYYSLILFVSTLISSICISLFNFYSNNIMIKIKSAMICAIYHKLLRIPASMFTASKPLFSPGEVINLASTDASRISNFYQSAIAFIALPIQLLITLFLLYQQLGLAFLSGLFLTLLILPINKIICDCIGKLNTKMLKWKDQRIKMMSEILTGIRMIKMQALEFLFERKVEDLRHNEIKFIKRIKYLDALCVYFWATTPVLISISTFSIYVLMGNQLTATKVFTSLALFNMLIMPLNALPWVLSGLVESYVSVKRVQSFLAMPELSDKHFFTKKMSSENNKELIRMQNCSFALYDDSEKTRKAFKIGPIDFILKKGDFIGLKGGVGAGKTSFLSSLIGEMKRIEGDFEIDEILMRKGIGYLSQEPWILNRTIKDNILFGKPFDELKYSSILKACALDEDLKILPMEDQTMVGDRGIALSGGQKSRIALARAVYQDFELYLLDDPYSSVDIHVGQQIKKECIDGLLRGKTKILATHHTELLDNVTKKLILNEGCFVESETSALSTGMDSFVTISLQDKPEEKIVSEIEVQVDEVVKYEDVQEQEKCEKGQVKIQVYLYYVHSIGLILSLSILSFFTLMQSSRTASDWWLSYWTTSIGNSSASDDETRHYLQVFAGIAVSNSFFTMLRAFFFAFGGIQAGLFIHRALLKNTISSKMSFFDSTSFGQIINRFSSDITDVDDKLPFNLNIFLAQIFNLIATLAITVFGIPLTLVMIFFLAIPYYLTQRYYRWTARDLKRLSAISLAPIYAQLSETVTGLSTTRAFMITERFINEMRQKIDISNRCQYSFSAVSQWLNLRLQILGVMFSTGVALSASLLHRWSLIEVNAGMVGLGLAYSLSITGLLNGVVQSFAQLEIDMVSLERIRQYLENSNEEKTGGEKPDDWPKEGQITFDSVSLRYTQDGPPALDNVSVRIEGKSHIGIVGRTGSGKTTFLQTLLRLVPLEKGRILLDGKDISTIALSKLRASVFVLPQDTFLFSGTLRSNLDATGNHSDEKIWKALRQTGIEQMVQNLGGLDGEIGGNGLNLSLGERQLLCLSRALLTESRVICLDESTSSIDKETGLLLKNVIAKVFSDCTVIIIAHKLEMIMDCNRIIVMDHGKIIEDGEAEVLRNDTESAFHRLWSSIKEGQA